VGRPDSYRAGVDIGGTFTDVVVVAGDGRSAVRKLLSTPDDYGRAVVEGLVAAFADLDALPGDLNEVIHATTIATNAILQRSGAPCALVTTEGFRDVLEIGRLRIPQLYDLFYEKRSPLVPRRRIFELRERIDKEGQVILPLDADSIERAVQRIVESEVSSAAVCLINSYANPIHERMIGEALSRRLPELDLSLSSDILPQIGEYERTSTTVINAYVKPVVRRYLGRLADRLRAERVEAPLFMMQCAGGLTTLERAAEHPVTMIESGPAAGVLAARTLSSSDGIGKLVSFDMGGTTAKASLIEDGAVQRTRDYEVGGAISSTARLTGGGGYPINIPVVDVAEVGAGGGSLAWIDSGGGLRVGPRSAGADPGPACYGLGGAAPTVTDANLVLGYLNPQAIAGGAITIDPELAAKAIGDRIAKPLGLDPAAAAYGIHLIANSEMMGAIRAVTTQRGRDLRDFAIVAFGGCGPLHAVELARAAGIRKVVVPPSPGLFSAFGLLTSALSFQRSRMFYRDVGTIRLDELNRALGELRATVAAMAGGEDGEAAELRFEIEADMHYWGQSHDLTVTIPFRVLGDRDVGELAELFEAEHESTFGHRAEGEGIILVALRVTGHVTRSKAGEDKLATAMPSGEKRGVETRRAFFGAKTGYCEAAVIVRRQLGAKPLPGPLLIEEYDSVTVVPPGARAALDAGGNIAVDSDAGASDA
jgi:N-methylhydantoinase A